MKTTLALLAAVPLLALVGCGHMDLSPEGDPARVLTGEIALGDAMALPRDTTVTVRVVDASMSGMPPQVLGSQTLQNPGVAPIPFRVEYRAVDALLLRGLNIEARVSYGGKVRYFNVNRYVVTLGNASEPHRIDLSRSGP